MRGPYVLSKSCVNTVVPPSRPGVYGLSNTRAVLQVLGRAERDICGEIKSSFNQYQYFWFELAANPQDAFRIECEQFHGKHHAKGETIVHPAPPQGVGWKCPVCGDK